MAKKTNKKQKPGSKKEIEKNTEISSEQELINQEQEENPKNADPNQEVEVNDKEQKANGTSGKTEASNEDVNESESVEEWKNKYLRLSADFDNYRKRTLKEKMDLIKSASKDVLLSLLPVLDDFERALASMSDDNDENKKGIELIYNKLRDVLKQNDVKEIDAIGQELDTDLHEAITKIPAPKEELKGRIVDVVEKGYLLSDKVLRFAKVVIGE